MTELPDLTTVLSLRDRAAFALNDKKRAEEALRDERYEGLLDATVEKLNDALGIPWNEVPEFTRLTGTAFCDFATFEIEGLQFRSKAAGGSDGIHARLDVRAKQAGSTVTWKAVSDLADLAKAIEDHRL